MTARTRLSDDHVEQLIVESRSLLSGVALEIERLQAEIDDLLDRRPARAHTVGTH